MSRRSSSTATSSDFPVTPPRIPAGAEPVHGKKTPSEKAGIPSPPSFHHSRSKHTTSNGTTRRSASEREKLYYNTPPAKLAQLLINEEGETRKTRKQLNAALSQLNEKSISEASRQIASQLREATKVSQAVIDVQQQAMDAQHTANVYKMQLEHAKIEITRAQEALKSVEAQRDDATKAAAKARAAARKFKEEKELISAREEGRRKGFDEGLERGRWLALAREEMRMLEYAQDPREIQVVGDGEAYIEEAEERTTTTERPGRSFSRPRHEGSDKRKHESRGRPRRSSLGSSDSRDRHVSQSRRAQSPSAPTPAASTPRPRVYSSPGQQQHYAQDPPPVVAASSDKHSHRQDGRNGSRSRRHSLHVVNTPPTDPEADLPRERGYQERDNQSKPPRTTSSTHTHTRPPSRVSSRGHDSASKPAPAVSRGAAKPTTMSYIPMPAPPSMPPTAPVVAEPPPATNVSTPRAQPSRQPPPEQAPPPPPPAPAVVAPPQQRYAAPPLPTAPVVQTATPRSRGHRRQGSDTDTINSPASLSTVGIYSQSESHLLSFPSNDRPLGARKLSVIHEDANSTRAPTPNEPSVRPSSPLSRVESWRTSAEFEEPPNATSATTPTSTDNAYLRPPPVNSLHSGASTESFFSNLGRTSSSSTINVVIEPPSGPPSLGHGPSNEDLSGFLSPSDAPPPPRHISRDPHPDEPPVIPPRIASDVSSGALGRPSQAALFGQPPVSAPPPIHGRATPGPSFVSNSIYGRPGATPAPVLGHPLTFGASPVPAVPGQVLTALPPGFVPQVVTPLGPSQPINLSRDSSSPWSAVSGGEPWPRPRSPSPEPLIVPPPGTHNPLTSTFPSFPVNNAGYSPQTFPGADPHGTPRSDYPPGTGPVFQYPRPGVSTSPAVRPRTVSQNANILPNGTPRASSLARPPSAASDRSYSNYGPHPMPFQPPSPEDSEESLDAQTRANTNANTKSYWGASAWS